MAAITVLAYDVGATWIRAAIYERGNKRAILKARTPREPRSDSIATTMLSLARRLLEGNTRQLSAIGVAIFGPIDYARGAVVNPPNHPAHTIEIRGPLEEELQSPVTIVNDAVAGAISGSHATGARDLVYVALGTGIGVGVIVDGRLLLGRRGDSHEAGHMVIDYRSRRRCGCGGLGHWEALFSGSALKRYGHAPEGEIVVAAGIASLVACYDPEIMLLGGGLVEAGLVRADRVARLVGMYSFQGRRPRIVRHPLGAEANLYGAYLAASRPTEELLKLNGW